MFHNQHININPFILIYLRTNTVVSATNTNKNVEHQIQELADKRLGVYDVKFKYWLMPVTMFKQTHISGMNT